MCPDADGNGKLAGLVSFGMTGCTDMEVFAKLAQYDDRIHERLTHNVAKTRGNLIIFLVNQKKRIISRKILHTRCRIIIALG